MSAFTYECSFFRCSRCVDLTEFGTYVSALTYIFFVGVAAVLILLSSAPMCRLLQINILSLDVAVLLILQSSVPIRVGFYIRIFLI